MMPAAFQRVIDLLQRSLTLWLESQAGGLPPPAAG